MNRLLLAESLTIGGPGGGTIKGPMDGINTLGDIVNKILPFTIAFGGIALFLILIWGGYDFLMSQGNPEKVKAGRAKITAAIVGFILLVSSYLITRLLNFVLNPTSSV